LHPPDPSATPAGLPAGLYVVATPIGNLGDLTARARATLAAADLIACEDTRHTRRLLQANGIDRPLLSYHEHNEQARATDLARRIAAGAAVALVSDAGTPGISDPGFRVVRLCRAGNLPVFTVPGPCAAIAALAVSGLPTDSFYFGGFLPPKTTGRRRVFAAWRDRPTTLVFYESAHRIAATLADIEAELGPDRLACLARELSKIHENTHTATVATLRAQLAANPARGECVLLVAKAGYQLE
jgi:16S rRNA (cytidine1402-2'-O)-methyltransferase